MALGLRVLFMLSVGLSIPALAFASGGASLKSEIATWLAQDDTAGVPELHRRRVLLATPDAQKTDVSVLVVHGLYNSPYWMADVSELFAQRGMNTLVSRLRGHFEADPAVLARSVRWQQWMSDTEADLALARKLGRKVILVGHSTGALLLTWLAIRNPDDIAGLVLFSPAIGVHRLAQSGAWVSRFTGFNLRSAHSKVRPGHAGLQVVAASLAFRAWLKEQAPDRGLEFAADRLKGVPVWMGNTDADVVIQNSLARSFFAALKKPSSRPHREYSVPMSRRVLHDAFTTKANPDFEGMCSSIRGFLNEI